MVSFQFVDRHGTGWMILPGLPADYPDTGEPDTAPSLKGLTFRADTGERRVLPRAAIPRRASMEFPRPAIGTTSRVAKLDPLDWQELLDHALVWPPV